MLIAIASIAFVLICLAAWLGMVFGRASIVNRLIDAKDPEGWQWAHYLRADLKSKSPQ
jgi:hypothetical protein